jgi:1,4-alpha-glucan branching enzyme
VILDWVPSFFARDEHGLSNFDGSFLYGHLDERQRENVAYDAYNFNYGRPQVSNFLIANGIYWVEIFHADGLRLSGLSSMLYMDYGKSEGQWVPNIYGGSENLEGVEFIKHFNSILHKMYPGVLTIAKETSAWPKITESLDRDGLGFDYAWNTGFMQDFIAYMKKPYEERINSLKDLTFSMVYAYSENYILPISHNEVYRNGGSLLDCMQMEEEWKQPFLRALYSFFMLHPGKKLTYMDQGIDEAVEVLNRMYKERPALSKLDTEAGGFEWLNCLDHGDGTLSFIRKTGNLEENLLVVANFSQNDYEEYKLGVSEEGKYTEIYNSNMIEAGGSAKLDAEVKSTKEEYYDGRNYTFCVKMAPMSVSIYSYRPFTKEELLEIAERKVAEIRAQLEKEALEKAKALEQMSLKDNLESKVQEARENILSGAEAEAEVKVLRKKTAAKKNEEKTAAKEPAKKATQKKSVAKAKAETKTKAEAETKAAAQKAEAKTDSRESKSVKEKK